MVDRLIEILNNAGVHAWEITDERTEGWEFYFIRRRLDQNRAKNVEHITVKVYQMTDGEHMGVAAAELPPTASDEEARALVADLAYRASLAPNPAYELNVPGPEHAASADAKRPDLRAISGDMLRALASVEETPTEDLNSSEIFVSAVTVRFVNSMGIDVRETFPSGMTEAVINARREGHEIELYRMYRYGSCDPSAVTEDIAKAMRYGKDRLMAVPTPELEKADVLFTGRDAAEIYGYFTGRVDASMIVRQMSDWKPGEPIDRDLRGDRVTVTAVRHLAHSASNRAFDAEGAPIRDTVLIKDGVTQRYLGSRLFSSLLGLEGSFIPTNYSVTGGTCTEEALRQGKYLEPVEFSDFQVDEVTGDIFGEIRLAYLHDGDTVTPVTGGSVSGSMRELLRNMRMSAETLRYNNMEIPAATLLKGVTVTGVEG